MERLSLFYLSILTVAVLTGVSELYTNMLDLNVYSILKNQMYGFIQPMLKFISMHQMPNPASLLFLAFGIICMVGTIKRGNTRHQSSK